MVPSHRPGADAPGLLSFRYEVRTSLRATRDNAWETQKTSRGRGKPGRQRQAGEGRSLAAGKLCLMELQEEMSTSDVVLLLGSVPERTADLVYWLDEARLRYRHGPAFPTLGSLIAHLVDSAPKVDALLRHAHLDGQTTADVRAAIDPSHDQELTQPLQEALEDFARVRRRTVDLLHGWGHAEWERAITDPRGSEMNLLDVCRLVAKHEMAHVAQIRNLSALLPEPREGGPIRPAGVNGQ